MAFSNRLRDARKNKGLTQEELGKAIGVVKATISSYENGSSSPDETRLLALIKVLEIDPNYLWQDEIEMLHKNTPDPAKAESEVDEIFSILVDGLVRSGAIKEGGDITAQQLDALTGIAIALEALFRND